MNPQETNYMTQFPIKSQQLMTLHYLRGPLHHCIYIYLFTFLYISYSLCRIYYKLLNKYKTRLDRKVMRSNPSAAKLLLLGP